MEKLCHGIYSKFGQDYRYYITMYDLNHIILFSTPTYMELDFRKGVGKCDFLLSFEMWLCLHSYFQL